MEISFRLDGEIQIVAITGAIGERETAAIRFKIDEKVNIGRSKFCFDLSGLAQPPNSVAPYLVELIDFCANRNTVVVLSGTAPELRHALIPLLQKAQTFFESVPEGVAFLKSEKPLVDMTTSQNSEEVAKSKALKELIEKYRGFWIEPEGDPLRLKFALEQFRKKPFDQLSKEEQTNILRLREKATQFVSTLGDQHLLLDQETKSLDAQVAKTLFTRKLPRNAEEESLQASSISRETDQLKRELETVEADKVALTEALKKLEKQRIRANQIAKDSEEQWKNDFESFKKILHDDLEQKKLADKKAESEFIIEKRKLEGEIKSKAT